MPDTLGVIITAGGSSTRFGADKLAAPLAGMTVLERSLAAFTSFECHEVRLGRIVVAVPLGAATSIAGCAGANPIVRCHAVGGASRAMTVLNALRHVEEDCDWIAVHDGARPLASPELIQRVMAAALEHGAAAPAVPVTSTIKQGGPSLPTLAARTLPRSTLWSMQTPQIMRRADLLDAFARCPIALDQVTDDAQLLELVGRPVILVAGDERNLKITTPLDLTLASLLIEA